jgi:putative flippase GtrA
MPKEKIKAVIDFFYPPFRKFVPLQTFRYAACGGSNVVLANITFAIAFHYLNKYTVVDLGFYSFKPYRIALFISSSISFVVGFLLNKYVVFVNSNIKGRVQLFRYFLAFMFSFFANNFLLQAFIEVGHMKPVPSQMITTVIIVGISYLIQHYFTFKVEKA